MSGQASASAMPLVLHVRVVTGTGGGPEKTILNSPRFLERHGYQSRCVFLHPPGDVGIQDIAERGRRAGTEIIPIPDQGPFDWRVLWALRRLCGEHQVAIWHGHDYKSNVFGLLLRRFHRMRLVTTAHGWGAIIGRVPLYNRIDRAVLPYYEKVICVSNDLAEICQSARVPEERLCVIENAIDLEQYQPCLLKTSPRSQLELPTDRILVGAVGRLSPEKGFDLLIRAVGELLQEGMNLGLLIAGEGPERSHLEAQIRQQSDPSRFRLLGHQSDLSDFYGAIDVYALSSLSEGLPNVLLEAMAMALPVVASRVGGVPQLIEDGITGQLVDAGDQRALTEHLRDLANNANQRQRLGEAARQAIAARYSFERRMAKMVEIYRSIGIEGARHAKTARETSRPRERS